MIEHSAGTLYYCVFSSNFILFMFFFFYFTHVIFIGVCYYVIFLLLENFIFYFCLYHHTGGFCDDELHVLMLMFLSHFVILSTKMCMHINLYESINSYVRVHYATLMLFTRDQIKSRELLVIIEIVM